MGAVCKLQRSLSTFTYDINLPDAPLLYDGDGNTGYTYIHATGQTSARIQAFWVFDIPVFVDNIEAIVQGPNTTPGITYSVSLLGSMNNTSYTSLGLWGFSGTTSLYIVNSSVSTAFKWKYFRLNFQQNGAASADSLSSIREYKLSYAGHTYVVGENHSRRRNNPYL